jgi:hypothetical protein
MVAMAVTIRSRFFLAAFAISVVAMAIAALAGAGVYALVGAPIALFYGFGCRQVLQLDARGIRYRSLWPPDDFALEWPDVTEIVLDIVRPGAPGEPRVPVVRARFVLRDAAPRAALLFSKRDGEPIVEVCRARGIPVVDERS